MFEYDAETGRLVWRINTGKKRMIGKVAGATRSDGYQRVGINKKDYYCHHIVWAICTGSWPTQYVDHIDGNPSNNRIKNLRECTQSQNIANSKRRESISGFKGVGVDPNNPLRWVAHITVNYKCHFLGSYRTPQLAHAAYIKAAKEHFGEFARAA